MNTITNIVILAGGDGDRFWPLHEKLLMPFLGEPLLLHMVEGLRPYGKNLFVVCNKANRSKMEGILRDKAQLIEQDEELTGMAGATASCKGLLHGDTLIMGNDMIAFDALKDLIGKMNGTTELVFLAKKVTSYFPGGYLQLSNGRLTGIVEKPGPDATPSDLVNLVLDYFRDIDSFISRLESVKTVEDDHYERAMDSYMKEGKADYVVYEGYWQALKYPWHVLLMDRLFRSTLKEMVVDPSATVSKTALIQGQVHIGKKCRIGDFVKITGPAYIGDNTIIGDYSMVRESSIGCDVMVGSGCEIARSYLGDGSSCHRNYIGDSVIGNQVLIGGGAVTANFRFDQKHVLSTVKDKKVDTDLTKFGTVIGNGSKVGVNATVFPGVKIGSMSAVAPGEAVSQDLHDNTYLFHGEERKSNL